MHAKWWRAAGLLRAGLLAGALLLPATSGQAASSKQETYSARTLVCLKLFFDDPAAHARECAGSLAPDARALGAGGSGAAPQNDCPPMQGGGDEGGVASDPCVKQQVMYLMEQGGLRFYRFAYVGDDHVYYGVMARELLGDPRFASAVHLSAAGYYTVDYDALGLIVPEEAAMRAAGQQAMDMVAATYRG